MAEHSATGGVKAFPIAGRLVHERERLRGMTDEDRAYRRQWLKDQVLSKNEPVHVPEYWNQITNPIRRFYQFPLNTVQKVLTPVIGKTPALHVRFWTGKLAIAVAGVYSTFYYFKYCQNDWTRKKGWRVIHSRKQCVPGDEGYPRLSDRTNPSDYAARGFNEARI